MKIFTTMFVFLFVSIPSTWAAYCNPDLPEFTPSIRFSDNKDGTTTDLATGLTWKRCSEGQTWDGSNCSGVAMKYTWAEALQAGAGSTFSGKDDWRVPNVKEAISIVERKCYYPSINETIFSGTSSSTDMEMAWYWTSTPVNWAWLSTGIANTSYYLDFANGANNNTERLKQLNVRLVRGGLGNFPSSGSNSSTLPVTGTFTGVKSGISFSILRSVGASTFEVVANGTSTNFIDSSTLLPNTIYSYAVTSDADPNPTIVKSITTAPSSGGGIPDPGAGIPVPVMNGGWLLPGMLVGVWMLGRRRKE